jgi:hypothetical protein
MHIYAQNTVV